MEYGLVGESLKHSWSKEIHNMINDYDYKIISLPEKDFDDFIYKQDFAGLNVTIPYKQKVIAYCKTLSEPAQRIGSVNTMTVDGSGNLKGYNTDYDGFIYMCKNYINNEGFTFKGKSVLILGSGGTGKTAKVASEDMGAAKITVLSRKGEHTYDDQKDFSDTDIIINTTPVGMYPNNGRRLIDLENFPQCEAVIDVIYNPLKTQLLMDAEDRGIRYTNGLPMLVAQAKFAGDIFLGAKWSSICNERQPQNGKLQNERQLQNNKSQNEHQLQNNKLQNEDIIKQVTGKMISDNQNIILIGMPGSGKTSIGASAAQILKRDFVDIDAVIEKNAGMSIPEIFENHGEQYFRDLESDTIKKYGKEKGLVISVGGGGILREENRFALRQNGYVVWIQRDVDKLETDGRPLSKSRDALKAILKEREGLYESISEVKIDNNSDDYHETAKHLLENLNKTTNFGKKSSNEWK